MSRLNYCQLLVTLGKTFTIFKSKMALDSAKSKSDMKFDTLNRLGSLYVLAPSHLVS